MFHSVTGWDTASYFFGKGKYEVCMESMEVISWRDRGI